MRLAILASPRHGNNWSRRVLANILNYPHFAEHELDHFPKDLPVDCIINIHIVFDKYSYQYIKQNDFRVIVLSRHPLDTLLSAWQFARKEPGVHKWLDGRCAIPACAGSSGPNEEIAIDWMCGEGAAELLAVSWSWWTSVAEVRVKYEDLVRLPNRSFREIIWHFGLTSVVSLEETLSMYSVEYFKELNNGWLGTCNNYAKFITASNCKRIYQSQKKFFDAYGYTVKEDFGLTAEAAASAYYDAIS